MGLRKPFEALSFKERFPLVQEYLSAGKGVVCPNASAGWLRPLNPHSTYRSRKGWKEYGFLQVYASQVNEGEGINQLLA